MKTPSIIITTLITFFTMTIMAGCGSEKSKTSEAQNNPPKEKISYESLEKKLGEEKLRTIYVDVTAHSTLNFLKDAIEDHVDISKMTPEDREKYTKERGIAIASRMAERLQFALEKNGITRAEWKAINDGATKGGWYNQLTEQISERKSVLKAQLEKDGHL